MTEEKPVTVPDYNWDILFADCKTTEQTLYGQRGWQETGPAYISYTFRDKKEDIVVSSHEFDRLTAYQVEWKYLEDLPLDARQSLIQYMEERYQLAQENIIRETSAKEDISLQKLKEAGVC